MAAFVFAPRSAAANRCVGCPFDEHRYFYKYRPNAPAVEGIFPVIYGGNVISKIGDKRQNRIHRGIDIQAPTGSPVVAAWSGKVFFAGWNSLGGWAVMLRHTNGYVTYYAHLEKNPKLSPGQSIVAGQRIGSVGQSGNAKGTVPHLHFEIIEGKKALDPLALL